MIDEKEVMAYVRMPACFMQGCSEDIVIFRADGGNHFTDYGIYTQIIQAKRSGRLLPNLPKKNFGKSIQTSSKDTRLLFCFLWLRGK